MSLMPVNKYMLHSFFTFLHQLNPNKKSPPLHPLAKSSFSVSKFLRFGSANLQWLAKDGSELIRSAKGLYPVSHHLQQF